MKKVLIINDSQFERKVLADLLTDLGKEVRTTGENNISGKLKEFQPNLLIVNLIMETTTGKQLIKSVKNKYPNLTCILSSSNSISLADYQQYQVDAVLQTPLEKEELASTLNKLEGKAEPQSKEKQSETNYVFCPYCGAELPQNQFSFCPQCGKKLSNY